MSAEENMALARRFMEARVKGDLDAMDEMMAPDFVSHTKLLPDQKPDREGEKWATAQFSAAVFVTHFTIEDQIVQGNKVVTKFSMTSTHRGEFLGVAPTGRRIRTREFAVYQLRDDRIAEVWVAADNLSLLDQIR